MNIENITNAAIETHLWADVTDETFKDYVDARALPVDDSTRELIGKDVEGFVSAAKDALERVKLDDDAIGHNFALTRNGHGAGFWDMGLGADGEVLTDLCRPFGAIYGWIENDTAHLEHG